MKSISIRSIQIGFLVLALSAATAHADKPRNPRGVRATGITLTVMGIINLALIPAFTPALLSHYGGDADFIGPTVGYSGIAICAVLGSTFLAVGIPLWVRGKRDMARPRVSLLANGLQVAF